MDEFGGDISSTPRLNEFDGWWKRKTTLSWDDCGSYEAWVKLVRSYTTRNLSYGTDKLPALSGLVHTIEKQTGDVCFAGLWKSHLPSSLCWEIHHEGTTDPASRSRPAQWRAPSWSFASVDDPVEMDVRLISRETTFASLVNCHLEHAGLDPQGELRSGYLEIEAPLLSVQTVGKDHPQTSLRVVGQDMMDHIRGDIIFDFETHPSCFILVVGSRNGLALRRKADDGDEFVRVGVANLWRVDPGDDLALARPLEKENLPQPEKCRII